MLTSSSRYSTKCVVYTPGIWDLLHIGHVRFLTAAKALGDVLFVGVPTDEVVKEDKGSFPTIPHEQRLEMLLALKCVDVALLYASLDFMPHLTMLRPNILAIGQYWGSEKRHLDAERWAALYDNQCKIVQIPYYHTTSTTKIKTQVCHTIGRSWNED